MVETKHAISFRNDYRKGERGSVLALSAISMLSLLLATGLAIDISHFYSVKAEMQNAADAAALAAASRLNSSAGGLKFAVAEATKVLNKYDFNNNNVVVAPADVTFAINLNGTYVDEVTAEANATNIRFVKVTIPPKPFTVTLASLVISSTQNLGATATAGMSVGLTMNKFYTAYTFVEDSAAPFTKGQVLTLSPQSWDNSSTNSYRVLSFGSGGDLVTTGSIHAYGYVGTRYNIAHVGGRSPNANPAGPSMCRYAKIGTNTRFGDYTVHPSANRVDEPPDTITQENISYAQYRQMQGDSVVQQSDGMANRRIMTLPISTNASYNTTDGTVTASDLAAFFIRRKMGADCTLEVEYIPDPITVPIGTYTPGQPQMAGLSIPVLYK